ncbi:hypothetical protein OC845_000343 [Tilletia horrida]|nr:hypothetical protein OC845_000343 [Tilletia horrida]
MSLSKYTDLPDIDVAGQDIYETPGLDSPSFSENEDDFLDGRANASASATASASRRPGASSGQAASSAAAAAGGSITQNSIDVESATAKFRQATEVDGRKADFSGALHSKPRKAGQLYPSTLTFETDTYEIRGYSSSSARQGASTEAADETPLEKLRRLRAETLALEAELSAQADQPQQDGAPTEGAPTDATAEAGGPEPKKGKEQDVSPLQILEALRKLKGDLAKLDAAAQTATENGPNRTEDFDARALIEKLSAGVKKVSKDPPVNPSGTDESATAGKSNGGATKELVQLESRLVNLENQVGVRPALVDESKAPARPLMPTIQRLEHQLTLFTQPRHLDAISRRVKVLVAELERAHEARAKLAALPPAPPAGTPSGAAQFQQPEAGTDGASKTAGTGSADASALLSSPDQLARLRSLFLLQTRLEPLLPLAPHLLSRLQSLSSLHASASQFSSSLDRLVEADTKLGERAREVEELCKGLEKSMQEDSSRVQGNFETVQARLEALASRLDALDL